MITKTNNRTLLAMSGVAYDFDFRIDDTTELEVYGITAGGVATQLTTGFSVAFSAADEEGTVTFDAEPSTYAEILMLRNRPYTQTTDIPIRGSFSEEDIEKALDQIVIQIQQLKELIDYCVKLDATSEQLDITLPAPVDGKALLWDGVTGALANSTINIEEFETEAAAAVQAATDAGTAKTAAEAAQSAAEAAAAAIPDKASQAQAEAGLVDTVYMTPLKTAQAIAALTPPLGAWASKSDNTVYQAATDGIVCVTLSAASGGDNYGDSKGYTDESNPPTTVRGQAYASDRDTSSVRIPRQSYTFPVKKSDYYKVVQTTIGGTVTQVIYWLPTGA